jgi:hypothetical protein
MAEPRFVRWRTARDLRGAHHAVWSQPGVDMSKGQHGNKEAKKPKKVHVPALPPGTVPADVGVVAPAPQRHKKH